MNNRSTKTALVTAGAKRIGAAIVTGLAERGFDIAIHYHASKGEADALRKQVEALGKRSAIFQADLTDTQSVDDLFANAREEMGPFSVLVNNASIFEPDDAREMNPKLWADHFDIHLKASVRLIELLHKQKLPKEDGNSGLAVNLIDQRVLHPGATYFSYTLSKSALWTATRTMALGLAPKTRVNAIGPGPTLPNIRQSPADFEKQVNDLPLGAAPSLEEFAATIDYFWHAKSVTGQMICLDGGQHLGPKHDPDNGNNHG